MDIQELVTLVISLGGITSFIVMIVNVGKQAKIVPEGQSSNVATGLEIAFVLYAYLSGTFGWHTSIRDLDKFCLVISEHSVVLVPFLVAVMSWMDGVIHKAISGFPLIGKTFTKNNEICLESLNEGVFHKDITTTTE